MSSFTLSIAIFEKAALASNPRPFQKPRCFYEIDNEKIEASQLSNCVAYWKDERNPASTVAELLPIILKNEILRASNFC